MSSNQNEKNKNSYINWKELSSNPNALVKNQDSLAITLFKKYKDSLEKK
jgi:hypothetical protein